MTHSYTQGNLGNVVTMTKVFLLSSDEVILSQEVLIDIVSLPKKDYGRTPARIYFNEVWYSEMKDFKLSLRHNKRDFDKKYPLVFYYHIED